jgi:hypothetical protein
MHVIEALSWHFHEEIEKKHGDHNLKNQRRANNQNDSLLATSLEHRRFINLPVK